jgi:hypothetical protein
MNLGPNNGKGAIETTETPFSVDIWWKKLKFWFIRDNIQIINFLIVPD